MNISELPEPDFVKEWVLDTGTSNSVISREDVADPERIRPAAKSKKALTANGVITMDKVLDTWLPALSDYIPAFVLKSTPNALSIGRLSTEFGYTFWWDGFMHVPRL